MPKKATIKKTVMLPGEKKPGSSMPMSPKKMSEKLKKAC